MEKSEAQLVLEASIEHIRAEIDRQEEHRLNGVRVVEDADKRLSKLRERQQSLLRDVERFENPMQTRPAPEPQQEQRHQGPDDLCMMRIQNVRHYGSGGWRDLRFRIEHGPGGDVSIVVLDLPPRVPREVEGTVLEEAAKIVEGARRENYGDPKTNHERTASMFAAYLGTPVTARQVCMLNVLQKVSRDAHQQQRDNLVDIAGYVRNIELTEGKS